MRETDRVEQILNDLVDHGADLEAHPVDFKGMTASILNALITQPFDSTRALPELDPLAAKETLAIANVAFNPEELRKMTAELLACDLAVSAKDAPKQSTGSLVGVLVNARFLYDTTIIDPPQVAYELAFPDDGPPGWIEMSRDVQADGAATFSCSSPVAACSRSPYAEGQSNRNLGSASSDIGARCRVDRETILVWKIMDRRTFLVTAAVLAGDTKLGISSPLRRGRTIALGDDQVQVVLEYGTEGLFETQFLVEKHPLLGLRGSAWTVEIDGAILRPEGIVSLVHKEEGGILVRSAAFRGETNATGWELRYELSGTGRITKAFTLFPKRDGQLSRVSLWDAECTSEPRTARTSIQDIAALYRQGERGLFASLDFPYSNISTATRKTTISYPPYDLLKSGGENTAPIR